MAATCIVFYGVRLAISEIEIESLELRTHPMILACKSAGMQYYWGNFALPDEAYFLYIGKLLGKFGVEDSHELQLTFEELSLIAADIAVRSAKIGVESPPYLHFCFQPG